MATAATTHEQSEEAMVSAEKNAELASQLTASLNLTRPPVAIAFLDSPPEGISHFAAPMSEPAPDGRAGRVPAGCVFWNHALESAFVTVPEDHGNCSIGSVTHGFKQLGEVAPNGDVAALVECGWIGNPAEMVLPAVARPYPYVYYGPLGTTAFEPDVVFLRLNAKQAMVIKDALPELAVEGKPQCHIIAIAKERGVPAISLGCMLSRIRTSMPPSEFTCALPYSSISDLVTRIASTAEVESAVARFAAADTARFAP